MPVNVQQEYIDMLLPYQFDGDVPPSCDDVDDDVTISCPAWKMCATGKIINNAARKNLTFEPDI